VRDALAVMYDVESREAGKAFREATSHIRNPMAQDVPGQEPPDQGGILFGLDGGQALEFNRGGGLLARLMHGHFEVESPGAPAGQTDALPGRAVHRSGPGAAEN
jgi:hypothetical protein